MTDDDGMTTAMEWVFGLGRSRLALRISKADGQGDSLSPAYSFAFRDFNRYPEVVADGRGDCPLQPPMAATPAWP